MRRKLFSDSTSTPMRRKLFSNSSEVTRRKLFSHSIEEMYPQDSKKVICVDCKNVFTTDGSTLHLLCPNCGSDRFEYLDNVTGDLAIGDQNPVDKVFSDVRRKLFCTGSSLTKKCPDSINEMTYICPDCSTTFESEEQYVDYVVCPVCGGKRCRKSDVDSFNNVIESEESFSEYEADEIDEFLSSHKGDSLNPEDVEAELHARGIYDEVGGIKGLVDSGYAEELHNGQVSFSNVADLQHRMFSKLVISVTKEFDIDLCINKESVLDSLSERLPEKSIMILRKSHNVIPASVTFSDKNYVNDSGISGDLSLEYGGTSMPLKDFMRMLSEEYPDAPEDIIDQLELSKTIKVNGSKVLINK